jgi:hypothetical protein
VNREQAGVCRACAHARWLRTKGGGELLFCRLSETDSRFLRYPPLPVLSCPGWSPASDVA